MRQSAPWPANCGSCGQHGQPPTSGPDHLTEQGNAIRLVKTHGSDLRYCQPWRKWLCWDGRRWRLDDTGEADRRVKDSFRHLYADATQQLQRIQQAIQNGASAEAMEARLRAAHAQQKWALASEKAKVLRATLDLAGSETGIAVTPDNLDSDHWALNCSNGTVDLRTGRLRPHGRMDMITKLCPTAFDPGACCPAWERFLEVVFGGNREVVAYIRRLLGYTLTGEVSEQMLALFYGDGSNGKSTLLNAVFGTLGTDYAIAAAPGLIMAAHGNRHPTELADLFGKRLAVSSETAEDRAFNEELIKQLTGSDPIKARRMREDYWQFRPTHKLILCTNHKPQVKGTDHAIWRRIQMVPFAVRFWKDSDPDDGKGRLPELRADKTLPDRLAAEAPGILAWMVQGCLEWQRIGLSPPAAVTAATAEYRQEQDHVARFLVECCETGANPMFRVRGSRLYEAYKRWAEQGGEQNLVSGTKFGRDMARMFSKDKSNGVWYLGVRLIDNGTEPDRVSF